MDDEVEVRRRSLRPRKSKPAQYIGNSDIENIAEDVATTSKPLILHENENVHGDKIFSFQERKRRDGLFRKVSETLELNIPKTPHRLREKLRKKIAVKIQEENSSSGQDFSDSGSEFVASTESEEESPTELSDNQSSDHDDNTASLPKITKSAKTPRKSRKISNDYMIKTDDYFTNQTSKKIITSNHTLDELETPRLPQDQLQRLLCKMKLTEKHDDSIKNLIKTNCGYFDKWLQLLHENFNVLVYGLGSKKAILDRFHQEYLQKLPVIVVNGFFPSITIKEILDGIICDLLELKESPSNIYEACELITNEFNLIPNTHLYLIVHNIEMIKGGRSQYVFSHLAAVDNIHLIASIDHINAPLVWDHSKLSKFNFTWWDITTYHPYLDETSFESSLMVQRTGTLALSSLRNVFLSLTSNSKGIYLILVRYQIENNTNQYYQGLPFKDLYTACREAFLVSSDLALRAQLSEFVDHKMVKFKRSPDGTEYLNIPISNNILQQFINEHSN